MKLKIDSAGRLILPKRIRDRFRFTPGSFVELEERQTEIALQPVEQTSAIVQRDGLWVYVGEVPSGFDWDAMVDDEREARAREILGS